MAKRAISGVIGILMWLGFCYGGNLAFALGVTMLATFSAMEWTKSYSRANALDEPPIGEPRPSPVWKPINVLITCLGVPIPLLTWYVFVSGKCPTLAARTALPADLLPILLVALCVTRLGRAERTGKALDGLRSVYGLVGFAYFGILYGSFVMLRGLPGRVFVWPFGHGDQGAWLMQFVALCVWATDTFAYFVGRGLGRHKLAPNLSPKKTIEGAIGGFIGAALIGAAAGFWIHLPLKDGIVIGAMAGIVGPIGDLFESALKREIGIKDFGTVIPGHGGALDRFDSLLFVAPLAYLYLRLIALV